jgi:hypothetical protein
MHVLYIGKVPSQLIPNKKMGILIQRTGGSNTQQYNSKAIQL